MKQNKQNNNSIAYPNLARDNSIHSVYATDLFTCFRVPCLWGRGVSVCVFSFPSNGHFTDGFVIVLMPRTWLNQR